MVRLLLALALASVALPAAPPGWTLTWSDEFDGASLDSTKWTYDIGGHGWGNNESQYYTNRPQNVYLESGKLVIKAINEDYTGADGVFRRYTSARLLTRGKFPQTYGRFEALLKIPYSQGIWPAFWMLGDDIGSAGWPAFGEIDIMENIGREPSTVHGTIHGPGYSGASGIGAAYSLPSGRRFADDFHLYAIEWEPDAIRWYVDDHLYKTTTPADLPAGARWVFDHPFHMLLNVAVGGNWPGYPDQTTVFPQFLQAEYVRVYKRASKPAIAAGGVVNGASFRPGFAPGSWVTILGADLAPTTRAWRAEEIVNGKLPTKLDGVEVTFNARPAYIAYISPEQINAQAPDTDPGPVSVEVLNNGLRSDAVVAEARVFDPAFFLWAGKYAVATRTDFSLVGPPRLFADLSTTPAKPGEIVILWGTGFGPANPPVPAGENVDGAPVVVADPTVRIGGHTAEYIGGALSPGYAALYQIAVRVPDAASDGDLSVVADVSGVRSPEDVFLTVDRGQPAAAVTKTPSPPRTPALRRAGSASARPASCCPPPATRRRIP